MSENKTTDVLVKVVELLTPLTSEERQRVVKAALTLIGETDLNLATNDDEVSAAADQAGQQSLDFVPKVRNWLKQNGIVMEELQEIFYFSGDDIEFISSDVTGNDNKEKTHNVYVISGVTKFLLDGIGTFDDKDARDLCKNLGCYDVNNHGTYMKNIGKVVTGSKSKGWTLTVPGLNKAASLIKEMGKSQ